MNKGRVQRYEWEDRLIEAESLGLLSAGAVNMSLRLASAITWEPKGNKPSGLYWKNESALEKVNSSRATYFRHRKALFELGFFIEERGNLIPQLPELSHVETEESQVETELSQVETDESQVDTPYTVNTYTVNSSTDNTYNDKDASANATASTATADAASVNLTDKNVKDKENTENNNAALRAAQATPINSNVVEPGLINDNEEVAVSPILPNEVKAGGAAAAGAGQEKVTDKWMKSMGVKTLEVADPFANVKVAPKVEKAKCADCNKPLDEGGLCWTGGCW